MNTVPPSQANMAAPVDMATLHAITQFYYREARLLDARQFQQWLALVTPDIRYCMPVRHAATGDLAKRETEAFLDVMQELGGPLDPPHRDEDHLALMIRVMRSFKNTSWTDNPPARTRRFVSNVEAFASETPGTFHTFSNVLITVSRHQQDNCQYAAQRQDELRVIDGDYRLARRTVIIDWNVIPAPSLGLFI